MSRKMHPGPKPPEPREPTPREQAALSGDIDTLWDELVTRHYSMLDQEQIFGFLLRAIEVRCGQDPEAFAGDTFARMIGFISHLALRSAFYINHRIVRHGRATQGEGPAAFPPEVSETLIPRLMDLQGHLTELIQAQAATARAWQLARAKRAEKDRVVGGDDKADGEGRSSKASASANGHTKPPNAPGAKPRKASAKDRSNGKSNGHHEPVVLDFGPVNRIGRHLDGHGSGSNGGGHDD